MEQVENPMILPEIEYKYTNWDKYYEAMAEKEDEEWSDRSEKDRRIS